jgi:hypothetical protein
MADLGAGACDARGMTVVWLSWRLASSLRLPASLVDNSVGDDHAIRRSRTLIIGIKSERTGRRAVALGVEPSMEQRSGKSSNF